MKQNDIRSRLIDGTIRVIARDGLDKATTKSIGEKTSINQAYIYRNFKDKEDMFAKAFDKMDDELLSQAMQHINVMYLQSMDFEMRCRFYFLAIWNLLLEDRDECIAYVRYYFSPYFIKYSAETHKRRFKPLVDKFSGAFREDLDVWMLLNHLLNVMLILAINVHNGEVRDRDNYSEHVFNVIYQSVKQYFRKKEEGDSQI